MAKIPGGSVRGSTTGRPIMVLFDVLGQRWTLRILWELRGEERLTFRDLQAQCDSLSPTILNRRLKQLRELAIVDHQEGGYGLAPLGRELSAHLEFFDGWAKKWAKTLASE